MKLLQRPKVGLALSGGSAKGFAHIGVIKELERAGIPIDYIAGTSMGALVGAFYAAHKNVEEMEKVANTIDKKRLLKLIDPTFRGGFITGNKVSEFLETHLGKTRFEDCLIPLKIVTTDIKTGTAVIFQSGELIPAIRGSISLPLIFTPLEHQGLLLTDGGLSVPLPSRIVRDMGADIVIAVNVLARTHITGSEQVKGVRGLFDMANISIGILTRNLAKHDSDQADILIEPDVSSYGSYQFDKAPQFIEVGSNAAKEMAPKIETLVTSREPPLLRLKKYIQELVS